MKNIFKIIIGAAILIVVDQLSKYFFYTNSSEVIEVVKNFFTLQYTENTGVAFSIPIPSQITVLISLTLIIVVAYLSKIHMKLEKSLSIIILALFFSGALGNVIDRIFKGFVIDFISIWKWPVFNLADTYIVIAVLLFIVFYDKIMEVKNKKNDRTTGK